VDVVGEPTYHWRLRDGEGGPSITQRRTEVRGLRDRIAAVEGVSRFLAARPEPEAKELKVAYDRSVLTSDLRLFLAVLPDADEEFRAEFIRGVNRFLNG
ncbi:hypothetical protein G3I76_36185, partial [Streptomyces sp. SID11233]|nr:hypothetical protein [Streptomyces sp. SID11233]